MEKLKKLTETEKTIQAEFKSRFEIPHSESKHMTPVDREIVRLTAYFNEYEDDKFFRQQYKQAWVAAGYSEYVFEYYLLAEEDGAVTVFCKEDAGS